MSADLSTALEKHFAQLPAVGLEELNALASLQTRVDRKYLVPVDRLPGLLSTFEEEMKVLATDGVRAFDYDSVYFDTPELDSYHLAAFGRRRRYKIRTRSYLNSGVSFLEVKTEGSRSATVKDRIPYKLADRAVITAECAGYITQTLVEAGTTLRPELLAPVLETKYARITALLTDSTSRATIDLDVAWTVPGRDTLVLRDHVVLETKSGSAPGGLDRHLWRAGIRPSRISKFATGMAALNPALPANRWHQTIIRTMPLSAAQTRTTP